MALHQQGGKYKLSTHKSVATEWGWVCKKNRWVMLPHLRQEITKMDSARK